MCGAWARSAGEPPKALAAAVSLISQRSRMSGKPNPDKDERVNIPLDPETALRALLAVDPDDEPADGDQDGEADQARGRS